MGATLGSLLHALPFGPLHTTRRFTRDPIGVQAGLLRRLLGRAAGTEWGLRYGFAEIAEEKDVVAAYQARVPLHHYDALRADVARVRAGAADVMWPGRFRHFAVSSGTASAGKVIPVSHEMLVSNRTFSVGVGLHYLAETGDVRYLLGRHLTLPGRIEEDPQYPGTKVGEVSGLQAEYAPFVFKHLLQAVPNDVSFLPNWEEKLRAIVERTMIMDVRLLVMAPTWALVLFRQLVEAYNARFGTRVTTVGEVWPNLKVFVSGGVALSSYRHLLAAQIGLDGVHFVETYGASEGFFAFQATLDDPSMLLHLDNGIFYEFVRMDEMNDPNARRYTVADVEPDVRYALFVSTCSGLWGYGVRDVLRFTSTFPHRIVVAGRTSEMLDRYGEAVFGEEARAALAAACTRTGALVRDFHVAPRPAGLGNLPSHQWLVEFERPPDDATAFAGALDDYLLGVNRHYQIRREARAFGPPEVVSLPGGTFYAWLQKTRGRISGQTKVPRMSEERTVAEGVLAMVGHNS